MIGNLVLVAIGSAIGGAGRYLLAVALPYDPATGLIPVATLLVNVSGSAVIGMIAGLTMPGGMLAGAPGLTLFLGAGILGGFTTFSAFSEQTVAMFADGEPYQALAYMAISVWACVAAAFLGLMLGTRI